MNRFARVCFLLMIAGVPIYLTATGSFFKHLSHALDELSSRMSSNVEAAVIGYGKVEGPFTEIDNLAIERDPQFPIRVTVQFYKATSNGVVSAADLQQIRSRIDRVYADKTSISALGRLRQRRSP